MKRALIITLLLLALSVSGLCLANGEINSAGDKVELAEKAVFGDKAAAEGVMVHSRVHMDSHLFWSTDYTIGGEPEIKTEYRFSQSRDNGGQWQPEYGVSLGNAVSMGFYFGRDTDMSRPLEGIAEAYRQLYNETPEGQEGRKTVYLKDYYDYYPLSVNISLPGTYLGWDTGYPEDQPVNENGEPIEILSQLQDYFRIPVPEDERLEIWISRDYGGGASSTGSGSDGDSFSLYTLSAVSNEACYFAFSNRTPNGKTVDTSSIPGGYGIYCLPYYEGDAGYGGEGNGDHRIVYGASVGELSTVYPIDTEAELLDLLINPAKTKLLLLTEERGKCVLTVIDIKSMETLQRLELAELDEETSAYTVQNSDDFLVLELSRQQILVVKVNEKGEYEHCFTAQYTDPENPLFSIDYNTVMDFDGEKLVIADFLRHEHYADKCGFYVAVCGESGPLYYGEYHSSLDAGSTSFNNNYNCRPVDYEPLSVSWE